MHDYRNLVTYRLAAELAAAVHTQTATWPTFERWTIGKQLVRAAGSIGANIAEAEGRFQPRDRRRFLFIARGSLNETRHWLELARRQQLAIGSAEDCLDELGKTLNGLIRNARTLASSS
ncbi:MAG: four helix bundle protein [Thermoleophilaceae bacterium]